MTKEELLRRRLASLRDKTKGPAADFTSETRAGRVQQMDNLHAGYAFQRKAHEAAGEGLKALDAGDLAKAESYAWGCAFLYMEALELRLAHPYASGKTPGRRGRPKK